MRPLPGGMAPMRPVAGPNGVRDRSLAIGRMSGPSSIASTRWTTRTRALGRGMRKDSEAVSASEALYGSVGLSRASSPQCCNQNAAPHSAARPARRRHLPQKLCTQRIILMYDQSRRSSTVFYS